MPAAKRTTSAKTAKSPVKEVEKETVQSPSPKKQYKDGDQISCISTTAGLLVMPGRKTSASYRWIDAGDEVRVDYSDLIAEIRARSNYVFKPRFVVNDDEFVEQNKDLKTLYDKLYSKNDLKQILRLSPERMRSVIDQLPDAVKDTLKSLAATEIDSGELDSIKTIKTLDEIFGTQLLLKMS